MGYVMNLPLTVISFFMAQFIMLFGVSVSKSPLCGSIAFHFILWKDKTILVHYAS